MKNFSRKQFLKTAAGAALVMATRVFTAPLHAADKFFREPPWKRKKPYWGYAIDVTKCIGCARCVDACKTENDVPREPFYFRTWVERCPQARRRGQRGFPERRPGRLPAPLRPGSRHEKFFAPKLCSHCENPPCGRSAPWAHAEPRTAWCWWTASTHRRYASGLPLRLVFSSVYRVADKCTLCYCRKGAQDACGHRRGCSGLSDLKRHFKFYRLKASGCSNYMGGTQARLQRARQGGTLMDMP